MIPPAAEVMQAARHQFLAGAGFAKDHDVGGLWCEIEYELPHLVDRIAAPDDARFDAFAVFQLAAQGEVLQHETALVERAATHFDQQVGRERLFDEVIGTLPHGADRHRHVAVAGDENHRQ